MHKIFRKLDQKVTKKQWKCCTVLCSDFTDIHKNTLSSV